ERIVVERLPGGVAPVFRTDLPVEHLGKGLRKPIGQRLEQNGVVIVVLGLEAAYVLLDANAGGDCEGSQPVGQSRRLRRNEVGQTGIRPPSRLFSLLAQMVSNEPYPGA